MSTATDSAGDDPRRSKDAGPPDEPRDPHGKWTGSGAQTESHAFNEWFGGSKIVGEGGKPLVVYHGSGFDISEFDTGTKGGGSTGNVTAVWGSFFTPSPGEASRYASDFHKSGQNVMPLFLSIKNPYELTRVEWDKHAMVVFRKQRTQSEALDDERKFRAQLEKDGYDGIIIKGRGFNAEYVAFHPWQIKSAIGNKGTFDPKSPKISDAASSVDPTGTTELRQRFRRAMDARWHRLRNLTSDAIAKSDILGIGGVSINSIQYAPLRGAGRVDAFQRWFAEGTRQAVTDGDGAWTAPYIAQAYAMGARRALKLVGEPMRTGDDRSNMLAALTISELHGVAGTTAQQATRAVAYGLGARQRPEKIARMVADRIKSIGRARSRTVVDYMVVKAFNAAILDTLRAAGVTWVHTIPEHLRGADHLTDAARKTPQQRHSGSGQFRARGQFERKIPQKRHKKTGQFVPFKPQPSGYLIKKAKKEYRQHLALGEDVDVLTAGDDRVCDICDDIAANGPYAIDTAEGLIPAHPNAVLEGSTFVSYGATHEMVAAVFRGPAIHIRTLAKFTTIGPNHPMLTRRGMVKANELHEGDELLYDLRTDLNASASSRGSDLEKVPLVQDAFDALRFSGLHSRVAATADDLHGDAMFCESEVEVIHPTRQLLSVLNSGGVEQLRELHFSRTDPDLQAIASFGARDLGEKGIDLSASGGVCCADAGVIADFYRWVRIEEVHEVEFSGFAFDASTATSLYCSDGFVVSNCRCSFAPASAVEAVADAGPPDEPRDPHGEWTSGGGAGGKAVAGYSPGIAAKGVVLTEKKKQDWRETSPKSVDEHYAVASDNQATLVRIAAEAARVANQGTKFANPGVKAKESLVRKLSTDKDRSPDEITDVVRAGFDVPSPEKADEVVSLLAKHAEVADQGWQTTAMGYFDRKAILRFHNGQMGEIQMWAPGMFDAKEKHGGHKLYEQSRVLPNDDPKLPELRNKQIELYGAVRAKLDPSVWGPIL